MIENDADITISPTMFRSDLDVPAGDVVPVVYDYPVTGATGIPEWSVVGSPHVIADKHGQLIYSIDGVDRGFLWHPLDPPEGIAIPYLGYDAAPEWKELPTTPWVLVDVLESCDKSDYTVTITTKKIKVQADGTASTACEFNIPVNPIPECPDDGKTYVLTCSGGMLSWTEVAEFECPPDE